MCIITDVFVHHVSSYGSSFFIIPFSPTSLHHIVSHYHIRLSGYSVAVSFVLLVSSGPRVAAQLDSVLVSVFTALCVAVRSSSMSVRLFSLSRHGSARFYSSRCSQRRVSLLDRLVCCSGFGVHSVVCCYSVVWCVGLRLLALVSRLSLILFFSVLTASCVAAWLSRVLDLDLCRFSAYSVACFVFV